MGGTMGRDTGPGKRTLEFIAGEIVLMLALRIGVSVNGCVGGRLTAGFDFVVGTKGVLYFLPPILPVVVNGARRGGGIATIRVRVQRTTAKGGADLTGAESIGPQ